MYISCDDDVNVMMLSHTMYIIMNKGIRKV